MNPPSAAQQLFHIQLPDLNMSTQFHIFPSGRKAIVDVVVGVHAQYIYRWFPIQLQPARGPACPHHHAKCCSRPVDIVLQARMRKVAVELAFLLNVVAPVLTAKFNKCCIAASTLRLFLHLNAMEPVFRHVAVVTPSCSYLAWASLGSTEKHIRSKCDSLLVHGLLV